MRRGACSKGGSGLLGREGRRSGGTRCSGLGLQGLRIGEGEVVLAFLFLFFWLGLKQRVV